MLLDNIMPNAFFRKFANPAKSFFKKADTAVEGGLKKLGGVARQVGNIAEQALPIASIIAPELAAPIALAGIASNAAKAGIDRAKQVQGSVRKGVADVKRTIQAPLPLDEMTNFNPNPMNFA
jgi:hypothetical protein